MNAAVYSRAVAAKRKTATGTKRKARRSPRQRVVRAQRFHNRQQLMDATRAECVRRANEWAGYDFWDESQAAYLRAHVHGSPMDALRDEAVDVYNDLRAALVSTAAFAERVPDGFRDGCSQFLRRFVDEVIGDALARCEFNYPCKLYGKDGDGEFHEIPFRPLWQRSADDWAPLDALVADFDKPGCWWWTDRRPGRLDLAVLSILAGIRTGVDIEKIDPTPARVIEAMASNVDKARARQRLKTPDPKT